MRYSVNPKGSPSEVIHQALDFFGTRGAGLVLRESLPDRAHFETFDGFVTIQVINSDPTELEILTQEYDHDVTRFIQQIT